MNLIFAGLLGFATAGRYPILQSKACSTLPERSGTIVTLGNLFGVVAAVLPLGLAAVAANWGLEFAMWLLLLGPLAVGIGTTVRPTDEPAA